MFLILFTFILGVQLAQHGQYMIENILLNSSAILSRSNPFSNDLFLNIINLLFQ